MNIIKTKNLNILVLLLLFVVILVAGFVQGFFFIYEELTETETEEGITEEYKTKIIQNLDSESDETIIELMIYEEELYFHYQTKELLYEHVLERLENQNFLKLFNKTEEVRKKFWEYHGFYKYDELNENFFDKVRQFFSTTPEEDFETEEEYEFTTAKIETVENGRITTKGEKASSFLLEGFSNKGSSIDGEGCLYTRDVPLCELDTEIDWGSNQEKPVLKISSPTNEVKIQKNFINNFADEFELEFRGTQENPLRIDYLGKEQYEVTGITRVNSETTRMKAGEGRRSGDFNDRYLLEQKNIEVESGTLTMMQDDKPYLKFEEGTKARLYSGLENKCSGDLFRTCFESQGFQGSFVMDYGEVSTYDYKGERLLTTNVHSQSNPLIVSDNTLVSNQDSRRFKGQGSTYDLSFGRSTTMPALENEEPRLIYANDHNKAVASLGLHAENFKGSLNMNMNNNPEENERPFLIRNLNKDTEIRIETGQGTSTIFDGERNIYSTALLFSSPDGFGNTKVLDQEELSYIRLTSYPKDDRDVRTALDPQQREPVDFQISLSDKGSAGSWNNMQISNEFFGGIDHLEALLTDREGNYFAWATQEARQFYADYNRQRELEDFELLTTGIDE